MYFSGQSEINVCQSYTLFVFKKILSRNRVYASLDVRNLGIVNSLQWPYTVWINQTCAIVKLLVIVASYGYVAEMQSFASSSQFNHIIVWRSYALAVTAHAKNVNLKCNLSHHQYRQLSILGLCIPPISYSRLWYSTRPGQTSACRGFYRSCACQPFQTCAREASDPTRSGTFFQTLLTLVVFSVARVTVWR